jgi:adenine deaminase
VILEGARVFNVFRRRFEDKSVLVRGGIVAELSGDLDPPRGEERIDASGAWLVPGLVDVHMHIESSMTTPSEFSRAVLPFGTTTVVADPHEVANVFGLPGIRAFMAERTRLDIFYAIPSSVPSTNPALETTGGLIGPEELADLARDERVLCLGEVMNAKELLAEGDTRTKRLVGRFRRERPLSPIEGHCPGLGGRELSAFIAAGVWSDHTKQTPESMLEKIDSGMFIELQRKSIDRPNIAALVGAGLYEQVCLVTDDVMPDRLVRGHLNLNVALAIEAGMRPEDAIYCATYTPSRHMGLRDRGSIAPGRKADFVLLDDLETFSIRAVYKDGVAVEPDRDRREAGPAPGFPPSFYTSIRRGLVSESDFEARPGLSGAEVDCVTIRIDPGSTATSRGSVRCALRDGLVQWRESGLSLLAVVERYGRGAPIPLAFVEGGLSGDGAVAASWAHDHHNILAMGSSTGDLALAVNAVIGEQGGYVVARGGKIVANARLPVGGIVSDAPIEELAREIGEVREAMRGLGYLHADEIMSFSTLSLLASPALKMSDKGLVDTRTQTIVGPYELPHR